MINPKIGNCPAHGRRDPASKNFILWREKLPARRSLGTGGEIRNSVLNHKDLKRQGFTLIELIVTISILVLISSISISNFRNGERQKRLALAADAITNGIHNAQNYALTGKQISSSNCAVGAGITDKSAVAYRTVFTAGSNTFTLYADDNCTKVAPFNSNLIETFNLPQSTVVDSSSMLLTDINGISSNVSILQFKYSTPFGQMSAATQVGGNPSNFSVFKSAEITVKVIGSANTRKVIIDGISGRIGE